MVGLVDRNDDKSRWEMEKQQQEIRSQPRYLYDNPFHLLLREV
jgi:hypothetical protein